MAVHCGHAPEARLGFVEDALLQIALVGQLADPAAESVHLVHQLALGRATDGWVAGLPGNFVEAKGEQHRLGTQAGRCQSGFAASMPTTDNDHVVLLVFIVDRILCYQVLLSVCGSVGMVAGLQCMGAADKCGANFSVHRWPRPALLPGSRRPGMIDARWKSGEATARVAAQT